MGTWTPGPTATSGNDTFAGDANDEIADGLAGNDMLNGAGGADTLRGGDGNDTLNGGIGDDTLEGGAGEDTADYSDAASGLALSLLLTGVQNTLGAGLDTLVSIENLLGSLFTDSLIGNDADNSLFGSGGNDELTGGGGNDLLDGGSGFDLARYQNSPAGVTVELARVGPQNTGGAGVDTLVSIEYLFGSAFDDRLFGTAGFNLIFGGAGNDILDGGAGADELRGGPGDDLYLVDTASDQVLENSGEGIDTVRTSLGFYGLNSVTENLTYSGNGNFTGVGNAADNVFVGGAGGVNTFDGLGGIDLVQVSYSFGFAPVVASVDGITLNGVTVGRFSNVERIAITGGLSADTLVGGAYDDTLDGGASGVDTMIGGDGDDTYWVNSISDVVTELADQGHDTIVVTILTDVSLSSYANIENLTYLGFEPFTGRGDAGANTIIGGLANDVLDGGPGDDALNGGAGADTLSGGSGNDTLVVDAPSDVVLELPSQGTDTIQTTLTNVTLTDFANIENLTYTGSSPFIGQGDGNANVIIGGSANDYVYAYGGDDTARGNAGVDVFIMADGADTVFGGDGQDYMFGAGGNDTLNGEAGVDVFLGGDGADTMFGGDEGDYFYGEIGDDTAFGENGNDIFVMTAGNDTATGGAGQDYFYMGDGNDTLNGGDGVDVMLGEAGDDVFNPGLGVDYAFMGSGADRLNVDKTLSGVTVLNDFTAGDASGDVISLTSSFTSFAQVQANIADFTASGGFCILTLDADTSIWFIGVAPSQLTAGDFIFGGG